MSKFGTGLASLILICLISGCASTASEPEVKIVTRTEIPHIPQTLLMLPEVPTKPGPGRSNSDMYFYRIEFEQYVCEIILRYREAIRQATLGQQTLDTPEWCAALMEKA